MIANKFQEQVFFTTVRISIVAENNFNMSIGTGFLLRTKLTENDDVILLIYNKHVLSNRKGTVILNFTKRKGLEDIPDLGNLHTININGLGDNYFEHPDPNIDLACFNLSVVGQLGLYFKTINMPMFANFQEEDLLPGSDIWFVGYPENRYDVKNNLPLLRKGYIASLPKVDFNSEKHFIVDAQVFQGSSGSPVFTPIGNEFKLIGVITATMIKHSQLEIVPTLQDQKGIQQILGLGIVIKSTSLRELVELAVEEIRSRISSTK